MDDKQSAPTPVQRTIAIIVVVLLFFIMGIGALAILLYSSASGV